MCNRLYIPILSLTWRGYRWSWSAPSSIHQEATSLGAHLLFGLSTNFSTCKTNGYFYIYLQLNCAFNEDPYNSHPASFVTEQLLVTSCNWLCLNRLNPFQRAETSSALFLVSPWFPQILMNVLTSYCAFICANHKNLQNEIWILKTVHRVLVKQKEVCP